MGIRIHIRSVGGVPIPFQFRQFPLRPERQNAGRAQEVIQLHQCNEQKFFIYLPLSVFILVD